MSNACPHKVIVAYKDFTKYNIFAGAGWRCDWCGQEFIPQPKESANEQPVSK